MSKRIFQQLIFTLPICFLIWSNPGLARDSGHNRIYIATHEFREFRRIFIQYSIPNPPQAIVQPTLQIDKNGQFAILIQIPDSNRYFGPRILKDSGAHPVKIRVSFRDSTHMIITGVTDKYHEINAYYSFGKHRYIFDIFWNKPVQSAGYEKSITGDRPGFDQLKMVDAGNAAGQTSGSHNVENYLLGNSRIRTSVILALGLCAFGLVVGILLQMSKHRTPNTKNHKRKGPAGSAAQDNTAIQKSEEEKIWKIADKKGLSYDEAAIIVNMSKEE